MQDRILTAGVVSTAVVILFLTAGAIPVHHGQQTVIFETPAFLTVVILTGLLMLAACFQQRTPLRQVAFVLGHAGFVLLMAGALTDWKGEKRFDGIRLPVAMSHAVGKLRDAATGQPVDLGFTLAVTNFSVAFYDPVYALLRPGTARPGTTEGYVFVRPVDPRVPSTLRHVPGSHLTATELRPHGDWLQELTLTNGWALRKQPAVPSWFEACVQITANGTTESRQLAVNHPLAVNGWQVLLVSYGSEPMAYVELAFKQSPGRRMVATGIWCVIAGVAMLCSLPLARRNRHASS
jgi:hypothetical protein